MKNLIVALLVVFASANLLAQNKESRNLNNFSKIRMKGGLNYEVKLKKADAAKIEISSDEYPIKDISISSENGTLNIEDEEGKRKSLSKDDRLKIYLTIYYTELSQIESKGVLNLQTEEPIKGEKFRLDMSGAGKTDIKLDVEEFKVDMSGAANLNFSGRATRQTMEVSGAGNINAEDLEGKEAVIEVSGVGKVNVNVSESLEAQVSGVGNVRYKGNPKRLISKASGIGNIKPY